MTSKTFLLAAPLTSVGLAAPHTSETVEQLGQAFTTTKPAKIRRPKRHKKVYAKHTRGW